MRKALASAAFLTLCMSLSTEPILPSGSVALHANPLKFFLGLPNLEIEYCVGERLGVSLFVEALVAETAIGRDEHPDLVVRLVPRWRFPSGFGEDLLTHFGPFVSYSHSTLAPGDYGAEIGLEAGAKYRVLGDLLLSGKGMIAYSFGRNTLFPGVEAQVGWVFR